MEFAARRVLMEKRGRRRAIAFVAAALGASMVVVLSGMARQDYVEPASSDPTPATSASFRPSASPGSTLPVPDLSGYCTERLGPSATVAAGSDGSGAVACVAGDAAEVIDVAAACRQQFGSRARAVRVADAGDTTVGWRCTTAS